MTAFCKVEGNYLKNEANMVKLFYHECSRQFADKILMRHDLSWFKDTLRQLVWDTFDLTPNKELDLKTNTQGQDDAGQVDEEVKLPDANSSQPPATAQSKSGLASAPTVGAETSGVAKSGPNTR